MPCPLSVVFLMLFGLNHLLMNSVIKKLSGKPILYIFFSFHNHPNVMVCLEDTKTQEMAAMNN